MSSQKIPTPIRVASVPYSQVYIRHLQLPDAEGTGLVRRLQDPEPAGGPRSQQSAWWPPRMLEPDWIRKNSGSFDLMHVHFGFDALDPQRLRQTVAELRAAGKPLVYTVHDLINPHQPDPNAHEALLEVLIPAADALITLTQGAADEISQRWGRSCYVLPHPHVIDFSTMDRLREQRAQSRGDSQRGRRIGVHLKEMRPNLSEQVIEPLAQIVEDLPGCKLQVNIHRQVVDPQNKEYLPALAEFLAAGHDAGRWDLVAHEYFSETELFDYFGSLDVNVLPYRYGTHSGWLEAALDAGTAVIAPDCGYYSDQDASVASYRWDGEQADAHSLRHALQRQLSLPYVPGMDAQGRREQREALAEAHLRLYRSLMGSRGVGQPTEPEARQGQTASGR